jgi:hypothetical protein
MKRAIRNLLRFVATAIFAFGALQIGLEFMRRSLREEPIRVGSCVLGGVLLLAGVMLFLASSRLAALFSDDDDSDDGDSTIQIPPNEP